MNRLAELDAELALIKNKLEELANMPDPEGDEAVRSKAIADRETETDDLLARWDELAEERKPLVARAQKLADVKAAAQDMARLEPGDGARYLGGTGPAFQQKRDPFEGDVRTLGRQEVISRAMQVLDGEKQVYVSDASKARVERMLQRGGVGEEEREYQLDGSYIARRTLLTENAAYRSAFQKYARLGSSAAMSPAEQQAVAAYQDFEISRAMSENTTTAGGFGIPVKVAA